MLRAGYLLSAALAACLALGAVALFLSGPLTTRAVQNPKMTLDMNPAGNSYDAATNTMTVGTVDGCLASPEANPSTHTHTAQIVVENIEDLVGWQARLNYNGDEMRPATVDFDPFLDTTTGQEVSFVNIPYDAMTKRHRNILGVSSIPTAVAGPQSALIGSTYFDTQDFPVSADTPPKSPPDDSSYRAPNGGVLASVDFEVEGDQSGRTMFMQLDNDNPNPPGSKFVVFNGTGTDDIDVAGDQLASGYHAEGAEMCGPVETPRDLVADLRVADVTVKAPTSVSSGEPFDIQVGVTVENKGPDETNARLTVWFRSPAFCFGPEREVYIGEVTVRPLSMATVEGSGSFSCFAAFGETRPDQFHVVAYAYDNADDPDSSDNLRSGEVVVNVVGEGPPASPTPIPMQTPRPGNDSPTPAPVDGTTTDPDPPVVSGSSSSDTPAGAGAPAVAQGNIQTPAAAVLAAAALPQTGGQGGERQPNWLLLVVVGGALGVTATAVIATRRLLGHRR